MNLKNCRSWNNNVTVECPAEGLDIQQYNRHHKPQQLVVVALTALKLELGVQLLKKEMLVL